MKFNLPNIRIYLTIMTFAFFIYLTKIRLTLSNSLRGMTFNFLIHYAFALNSFFGFVTSTPVLLQTVLSFQIIYLFLFNG